MLSSTSHKPDGRLRRPIPISIDRRPYKAPKTPMTGAELRKLAVPDIGPDRDLYADNPSTGGDLIGDAEQVELHSGKHFFSVPKQITEG